MTTSYASSTSQQQQLPVAAFIDLDNIGPQTYRRQDIKNFISPLLELGRLINHQEGEDKHHDDTLTNLSDRLERAAAASSGKSKSNASTKSKKRNEKQSPPIHIEAFGNLATRQHQSPKERQHTIEEQEYIPWSDDEGFAQTGYDATDGILRCGICGAKMKLSKKDRAAGRTEYDKLKKHMKSLHDREQAKRINRMQNVKKKGGKKKRLPEKEMKKYKKYQAAQVGLRKGTKIKVDKSGKVKRVNSRPRNDLFAIMKEMSGVTVKAKDNVDEAIINRASQWMNKTTKNQNGTGQPFLENNNWNGQGCRGVLVIYSMDADFVPLLQKAKKKGFMTVSMTNDKKQTLKLERNCDVVVSSSSFDNWVEEEEGEDESDDDEYDIMSSDDDDYEIRNVNNAPLSLLSSSKAKSFTTQSSSLSSDESTRIHAISKSDDGHNFMIARSRSNGKSVEENRNFAQWDLGDGGSLDMYTGVGGHGDTVEAKDRREGPKVPSMKTLRKQHDIFAKLSGNHQYTKRAK